MTITERSLVKMPRRCDRARSSVDDESTVAALLDLIENDTVVALTFFASTRQREDIFFVHQVTIGWIGWIF